jgi:hypothetical protein
MKTQNYQVMLKLAAFLIPFYYVFYVPSNESFSKTYSRYIICGFCFYALIAAVLIASRLILP